jgi:hypothetical protein
VVSPTSLRWPESRAQPQLTRCTDDVHAAGASIAAWRINAFGVSRRKRNWQLSRLSTPTVGVVKQRNSGFAVAGIDNPLFYADPISMLRRRPRERREVTDELKAPYPAPPAPPPDPLRRRTHLRRN